MIIYVQPQLYIYIFIFIFAYLIFTYLINFFWLNIKITKDGIKQIFIYSFMVFKEDKILWTVLYSKLTMFEKRSKQFGVYCSLHLLCFEGN